MFFICLKYHLKKIYVGVQLKKENYENYSFPKMARRPVSKYADFWMISELKNGRQIFIFHYVDNSPHRNFPLNARKKPAKFQASTSNSFG